MYLLSDLGHKGDVAWLSEKTGVPEEELGKITKKDDPECLPIDKTVASSIITELKEYAGCQGCLSPTFIPHFRGGLAMLTKGDLLKLVREYYGGAEMSVSSIPRREMAFLTWDNRMVRHQAFNNEKDLQDAVVKKAPKAVYASLSKYLDPSHRTPKGR